MLVGALLSERKWERVLQQNVTQARPVRPDVVGGEDPADSIKKVCD